MANNDFILHGEYDIKNIFGKQLKKIREARGMSLYELLCYINEEEIDTNIDYPTKQNRERKIRLWEHGSTQPPMSDVYRLCEILDCDFEYLIGKQDTYRRDCYSASEYLDIDYKAIEIIKNYEYPERRILQDLILTGHLFSILRSLRHIIFSRYKKITIKDPDMMGATGEEMIATADTSFDIYKFIARQSFDRACDYVYDQYKEAAEGKHEEAQQFIYEMNDLINSFNEEGE